MPITRRTVLSTLPALLAWPAFADETLPEITDYERETGGRVGLYAEELATGRRLAWRADERFVMCSTFKVSLAALVLSRVDRHLDELAQPIRYGASDVPDWHAPIARQNLAAGVMSVAAMCEAAVEYSDNTCANLLLARVGGPAALTAFWRAIGDATSRLDHDEPLLNRSPPGDPHDTTTPRAMAMNLRRLLLGDVLSANSRARLADWMLNCQTGANRLRAGLPARWRIADKTGNNGSDAAGDIAVAWPAPGAPVLACVYLQGGAPTAERIDRLFRDIGQTIGRAMG